MSVRVAIAGVSHETNTYSRDSADLSEFLISRGGEILDVFDGTETYIGGALAAAREQGFEPVPLIFSEAMPSGVVTRGAFEALKAELLERVQASSDLDGVVLALHGAAAAEGIDDLDGDLCTALRTVTGNSLPIVACLDLHANITPRMVENLTQIVGIREYPHTDTADCGRRAVLGLARVLREQIAPVPALVRPPMLMPAALTTADHPAGRINALCTELVANGELIDCTFFHGFPYADSPAVGASILSYGVDAESAEAAAATAAAALWRAREEFRLRLRSPEESVAEALKLQSRPVVINEVSDNPGGGAPGDGTRLLAAMLAAQVQDSCFGMLYDPDAAAAAHRAGLGSTVDLELGGKTDDLHGHPLRVRAAVEALGEGDLTYKVIEKGFRDNVGKTARLTVQGIDIIVVSARRQVMDDAPFETHGIDVRDRHLVGLKSANHFRAAFTPLSAAIVSADGPGLTSQDLAAFSRERTQRPVWPLDDSAAYPDVPA